MTDDISVFPLCAQLAGILLRLLFLVSSFIGTQGNGYGITTGITNSFPPCTQGSSDKITTLDPSGFPPCRSA